MLLAAAPDGAMSEASRFVGVKINRSPYIFAGMDNRLFNAFCWMLFELSPIDACAFACSCSYAKKITRTVFMIDVIIKIPFLPEEDDTEFQELKFKIPIRSDFNYLAGLLLSLPQYSMIAGYDFHPCDGDHFELIPPERLTHPLYASWECDWYHLFPPGANWLSWPTTEGTKIPLQANVFSLRRRGTGLSGLNVC